MRRVTTLAELRAVLGATEPGLVPTMGALHEGHLSLIRRSAAENERTVVSVFVNPAQFASPAEAARYPRDAERDVALAAKAGAEMVFAPSVDEIYPTGFATTVEVSGLGDRWEGEARPGHFRGVATVVAILLNAARPARSYFGEKDYQQLQIVRRLHADLALPGRIVAGPTIRDPDGLALSSRNAGLTPAERERAAVLPRSLVRMRDSVLAGARDAAALTAVGRATLQAVPEVATEYLAVVDGDTLEPVAEVVPGARVIVAARLGSVRLIDNLPLDPEIDPGLGPGRSAGPVRSIPLASVDAAGTLRGTAPGAGLPADEG